MSRMTFFAFVLIILSGCAGNRETVTKLEIGAIDKPNQPIETSAKLTIEFHHTASKAK